jgi:hypothetical protein
MILGHDPDIIPHTCGQVYMNLWKHGVIGCTTHTILHVVIVDPIELTKTAWLLPLDLVNKLQVHMLI